MGVADDRAIRKIKRSVKMNIREERIKESIRIRKNGKNMLSTYVG